uniref:Chemokine interleukin-8-like domain-containing protein n=1 Tax=Oreochromis aureus TaxID=47969 RepID=A0A668VGA2_OREAU
FLLKGSFPFPQSPKCLLVWGSYDCQGFCLLSLYYYRVFTLQSTLRQLLLGALIAQLKVDEPRPHCNKKEVIVTLKDGREQCLDPESKFTKTLLEKLNQ